MKTITNKIFTLVLNPQDCGVFWRSRTEEV